MGTVFDKILGVASVLLFTASIVASLFGLYLYKSDQTTGADKIDWPLGMHRLPLNDGFMRYANDEVICYELHDRISCIRNYLEEKHGKR